MQLHQKAVLANTAFQLLRNSRICDMGILRIDEMALGRMSPHDLVRCYRTRCTLN